MSERSHNVWFSVSVQLWLLAPGSLIILMDHVQMDPSTERVSFSLSLVGENTLFEEFVCAKFKCIPILRVTFLSCNRVSRSIEPFSSSSRCCKSPCLSLSAPPTTLLFFPHNRLSVCALYGTVHCRVSASLFAPDRLFFLTLSPLFYQLT